MTRSTTIAAAVLAALPLSAVLAGTASADSFRDSSLSLGPGGLCLDAVTSSATPGGTAEYAHDHLSIGPDGVTAGSTGADAGAPGRTPLTTLTDLLGVPR